MWMKPFFCPIELITVLWAQTYTDLLVSVTQPIDMRQQPNILITGTPGTGKTSMCQLLAVSSKKAMYQHDKLISPLHLFRNELSFNTSTLGSWYVSQNVLL
jgi:replication-associated recombination protein RarA